MTATQIVRIVVALAAFTIVIWLPLELRVRRVGRRLRSELANEPIVRGPDRASLRGPTTRKFDMGQLALTDQRLVFYRTVGAPVAIPRASIAGARPEKWFRGARALWRPHLVVSTTSGDEHGFMVRDVPGWISALASRSG
ncbi:MAG TPA: hypothetical protein VGG74_33685 [Kofleriaceae bacterium]|jgi:hypothetical protein